MAGKKELFIQSSHRTQISNHGSVRVLSVRWNSTLVRTLLDMSVFPASTDISNVSQANRLVT